MAILAGAAAETGYAALAIGIALGATYAVLQAFTVALPHLAGDDARPELDAEAVLRRLAGLVLVGAWSPAAVVLAVCCSTRWCRRSSATDYAGAVDAFGPALALVVLAPLNALAVQASALRLRPDVALARGIAAAAAFVVVALLAVPAWGAAGGTAAALAGGRRRCRGDRWRCCPAPSGARWRGLVRRPPPRCVGVGRA